MIIGKYNVSLNSYLGKVESGILALLSIIYEDETYEGTYWYKVSDTDKRYDVITVDCYLDDKLGYDFSEDENYEEILKYLIENSIEYKKGMEELTEYNLNK